MKTERSQQMQKSIASHKMSGVKVLMFVLNLLNTKKRQTCLKRIIKENKRNRHPNANIGFGAMILKNVHAFYLHCYFYHLQLIHK